MKTLMLPLCSAWVFFFLSPCSRAPRHDLVSVLGLVGLVPVVFSHHVRRHIPFLAWMGLSFWSAQVFMGLLPVALPQRSDTDMPRSACFQPKTTIIEAQTRENGTISGVQHNT